MTLEELNTMTPDRATAALRRCCGSQRWARDMVEVRPFESAALLASTADRVWLSLDQADWLEAFEAHPRIGDRVSVGGGTGPDTSEWSGEEQRGAASATDEVLKQLRRRNEEYRARFGFTFIVCATGKTADEMLETLEERMMNDLTTELHVAAEEQRKIIRTRLLKLIDAGDWVPAKQQQLITTHVLDTSRGGAAVGVAVILEMRQASDWIPIGRGHTDRHGRVMTLMEDRAITPGTYRLTFDIGTYFRGQGVSTPFFPQAKIVFVVRDPAEHYHVPLLISPFGYSTYRGT